MHYSADNNCDSLSGPGGKMGPWLGARLKKSKKNRIQNSTALSNVNLG